MKKVNQKNLDWEIPTHEDPKNPGALKRVIVKHEEVEEIFLFQDGRGEINIDGEASLIGPGDRIIVPAKSQHEIRNLGKNELKFIGIGIALD